MGRLKKYRRIMPRSPKKLIVPSFIVVRDKIPSIVELVNQQLRNIFLIIPKKPLIVADENTWEIAGQKIYDDFPGSYKKGKVIIESNRYVGVEQIIDVTLSGMPRKKRVKNPLTLLDKKYGNLVKGGRDYNVIYAVGGGSVIDVAKYAAYKRNIPCISIATSLANDGFASQFSVLNLNEDGVHTLRANVPLGVIVDLELIKDGNEGYERRIMSGIGDLLSNITASIDWEIAAKLDTHDYRHEDLDDYSHGLALFGAQLVLGEILRGKNFFQDGDSLRKLAMSLIFSAEAMERYGSSRPASGFEHKLYHMYNQLTGYKTKATHGELVAVGALISSYAHGKYFKELKEAFQRVGLPTTETDLQQLDITKDDLTKAIKMCETFRPERYTILEKKKVLYMQDCVDKVF